MALRAEVDKLSAPPSTYGVYLSAHDDDTVDILAQGKKVRVGLHPTIKVESLRPGQDLLLNEALNVVATAGYEIQGDVVVLEARLDDDRAVVTLHADDQKIGIIADPLRTVQLKPGAKIAGRKGERIVAVKSLVGHTRQPQRNMEKVVTTGQYL